MKQSRKELFLEYVQAIDIQIKRLEYEIRDLKNVRNKFIFEIKKEEQKNE